MDALAPWQRQVSQVAVSPHRSAHWEPPELPAQQAAAYLCTHRKQSDSCSQEISKFPQSIPLMRKITLLIFRVICAFFYVEGRLDVSYMCWVLRWFHFNRCHGALLGMKHHAG